MENEKNKNTARFSKQRECIMQILSATDSHPTANYIFDRVREQIPNISLGTVYRNLARLCEEGRIIRIESGDAAERYDARTTPHYHIQCVKCGAVADVFIKYEDRLDAAASEAYDGRIEGHSVMFRGICKKCCEKNQDKD